MSQAIKFLKDFTYNAKYEFLELAKDKTELEEVAGKARIVLPNYDLSIFKCVYAYVDRQNLNGCTLPREQIESVLGTLIGKAIDFDHLRKKVVGHWIDIKIEGDKIIAYGAFFKGNFQEDYELVKSMFEEGTVAISFEAYGRKDGTEDSYDLLDVEFSGGALLIKTSPAFPGTQVEEMANKTRVLELASTMTEPKSYLHTATEKKELEKSKLDTYDTNYIVQVVNDTKCPICKSTYWYEIKSINYRTSKVSVKCFGCNSDLTFDLKPTITVNKEGVIATTDEIIDKGGNINMDIKELEAKIKEVSAQLDESNAKIVTLTSENEANVAKIAEFESKKGEDEATSVEELTAKLEEQKKESLAKDEKINELAEEVKTFKEADEARSEEAKATKLAERKAKLGEEYSKDLTDEQILNDADYKIATLTKQVALLKDGKSPEEIEKAQVLETGTKPIDKGNDKISKLATGVRTKAWGPEDKKE